MDTINEMCDCNTELRQETTFSYIIHFKAFVEQSYVVQALTFS